MRRRARNELLMEPHILSHAEDLVTVWDLGYESRAVQCLSDSMLSACSFFPLLQTPWGVLTYFGQLLDWLDRHSTQERSNGISS